MSKEHRRKFLFFPRDTKFLARFCKHCSPSSNKNFAEELPSNSPHLMHVILHSKPLLVADGDPATPPFVIVAPLLRVTENLFRVLRQKEIALLWSQSNGSVVG